MKRTIVTCDLCQAEIQQEPSNVFKDVIAYDEITGNFTVCTNGTKDGQPVDLCPNCVYRIIEAYVKKTTEEQTGGIRDFDGS